MQIYKNLMKYKTKYEKILFRFGIILIYNAVVLTFVNRNTVFHAPFYTDFSPEALQVLQ